MSELRLETLVMPTAPTGPANPLPPLFAELDVHQVSDVSAADAEMRRNIGYGRVASVMPYLQQDGFTRDRRDAEHRVVVLENDVLRATFLIDLGGRLWSLVHKPSGRELLHVNPVLQPANLALRNAWFAGGVEWNISTIGHSPLTCEPLHAVKVELPDGTPALRMYEYERIRGVVFQVDAWLPDDSPVLLVSVRIINPNDADVPMYWWSNIAVPQADDVRVLAPADSAWRFSYDGALEKVPMPGDTGVDRTYATRADQAADYFFDVSAAGRRWVAALDGTGAGLVQTSTDDLRGRKLFVWGAGRGGEHWQEWLGVPGRDYLEIQAGLARTQLEHVPMAARSELRWLEAYGLLAADPAVVHGADWTSAHAAADSALQTLISAGDLVAYGDAAQLWLDAEPNQTLGTGSGWGALERLRRSQHGDTSLELPGAPFPDSSLGAEQRAWLQLLETGEMEGSPSLAPDSYQVSTPWRELLDKTTTWLGLLHLGVARAHEGDLDGAEDAWNASIDEADNAVAWRNLAQLHRFGGDLDEAVRASANALALRPDLAVLLREHVDLLIEADRSEEALERLDAAPEAHRAQPRIRLAEARAALDAGEVFRCQRLLDEGIVLPDLREGEATLHLLWQDCQAALAAAGAEVAPDAEVPRHYDFRMFGTDQPQGETS